MSAYITTKEAARLLNTSTRSIRRKVSALSPQLSALVRKDGNKILIDKRLVEGNFKELPAHQEQKETPPTDKNTTALTQLLESQLKVKDKQIEQLTNRIQEQNIIIARSQEQNLKQIIPPTAQNPPLSISSSNGSTFVLVVLITMLLIAVFVLALD